MKRNYKTSKKNRTEYIYYGADGSRFTVIPGEEGVTETIIDVLHTMDDQTVDEQRRYEYRVTTHLEGYCDVENNSASDRNEYLADESFNPEAAYIQEENQREEEEALSKIREAMELLKPEQRELYKKKYVDNRPNTDIAEELGVSETAIRKRLKVMKEKLYKHLQ